MYGDEIYADLFVQIGEQSQRPLHQCILASRAFKFFSALKGFKLNVESSDGCGDIIVGEIQKLEEVKKNPEEPTTTEENLTEELEAKRKKLLEALEPLRCQLPEEIFSPELFLNFVRRAYLDTDLSEEETNLNQRIAAWLKINRPELIKPPVKCLPDHRESFRTIQPDFEHLSISGSSSAMSTAGRSSAKPGASVEDTESNHDQDVDQEISQVDSVRDESLTGSLLTRTETFELISKNQPDSPEIDESVSRNNDHLLTDDDAAPAADGRRRSASGSVDANESDSSEVYRTTTRTGLKPKQFTTPVGIRASKTTGASPGSKTSSATKTTPKTTTTTTTKQPPTAAKRSSLNTSNASETSQSSSRSSITTPKSKVTASSTTKPTRPTVIASAHPISMERSQSPGTNLIVRGASNKNFIAANKRLVAKMEVKKAITCSPSVSSTGGESPASNQHDSEATSDLLALEPLTTDNLAAQLDKFTLVAQSKLAEALSRMFIDEILTDSIIEVSHNKRIHAHKCILAIRSPYLNDLINRQALPLTTPESVPGKQLQALKLDLTEFSYPAVYFSILHIYSGIVKVPEDLDLEELTKLSNLLHVNTLRLVCQHNLRMNYCHFFHKPCNVCCLGVLKTLPLAWRYDYTELYSKCLQWIGAHFANIFCLEEFSKLKPHDLIEECYNETLSQLTPDNVIQRTIECQRLLKNLPRVKWTESIICLVGRQLEDFCHYVADNYEKILQTESFLNLGKSCWECEILEENLLAAMNHLKPDSGCKTLIQLDKIECSIETYCDEPRQVSESFANLVAKMRKYCERYLLKEATSVVHCASWRQMNQSLQKKIKDQALLATDFDEPAKQLAAKPKLPSMVRHQQRSSPSPQLLQQMSSANNSGSEGTRSPSNRSSTPDSRLKSPSTTYLPPPKAKPAATRQVKVLK